MNQMNEWTRKLNWFSSIRNAFVALVALSWIVCPPAVLSASALQQDDDSQTEESQGGEADGGDEEELQAKYDRFEEMLSGSKLIGTFTIKGREDRDPQVEEYTITSVKKLPRGDYWQFKARIKYGDRDYELPIPLEVKWADDTPMISLTDLSFLGQGPFSARIIFYDGMYAGTWAHGEVGGHMFGRIEKVEQPDDE